MEAHMTPCLFLRLGKTCPFNLLTVNGRLEGSGDHEQVD